MNNQHPQTPKIIPIFAPMIRQGIYYILVFTLRVIAFINLRVGYFFYHTSLLSSYLEFFDYYADIFFSFSEISNYGRRRFQQSIRVDCKCDSKK